MNYIVTTIIMQLHLVVMYRLLFLGVALLTQTNGTTSHTHRFDLSEKSIYFFWGGGYLFTSDSFDRQVDHRIYTD